MRNRKNIFPTVALSVSIMILLAGSIFQIWKGKAEAKKSNQRTAKIYSGGVLIQEVDLSSGNEIEFLIEDPINHGHNRICVADGEIGVTEASCPDKRCQQLGMRQDASLPIICLPNHLTILIDNESISDSQIDGVTY